MLILALGLSCRAGLEGNNIAIADSIKQAFGNIEKYRNNYIESIDSLKSIRNATPHSAERVLLSEKIGRKLVQVDVDSALLYMYLARLEALELGLDDEALRLRMVRQSHLPLTGMDKEAYDNFSRIDRASLTPELKKEYWKNYARLNYLIDKHYPNNKHKARYRRNTLQALDSLVLYYPEHSETATYITAQLHLLRDEKNLAVANLIEIQAFLNANKEYEMESLGVIADFYHGRPTYKQLYENSVLRLALQKIRRGNPEPRIIAEAGKILYDEDEHGIGRDLILWAMAQNEDYYGPYRSYPHWEYTRYLTGKAETVRLWIAIVFILLVASIIALVVLFRRIELKTKARRKLQSEENDLLKVENNNLKKLNESIIALSFLAQDQLREYGVYVSRKLKAGQVKDLFQEIESGNYMNSLGAKFFTSFDEMFLNNCPDFIEELNKLLLPDRQLAPLPDQRMSPEIRIAAFMRLGINDSAKLAQTLGLSLNTIYTYRNRLKGRAIDRANFENSIMKIPFNA